MNDKPPTVTDVRDALREYYFAKVRHDDAYHDFQTGEAFRRFENAKKRLDELLEADGNYKTHSGVCEERESFKIRHLVQAYGAGLFTSEGCESPTASSQSPSRGL